MGARLAVLIAFFSLAYGALLFRLYELQIMHGETYAAKAASLQASLEPERGTIYFMEKNGKRVAAATVRDAVVIYAVPKEIEDPRETANQIAPLVNLPASELVAKFSKPNDPYELIKTKVEPAEAYAVQKLGAKGIRVATTPERSYSFGERAAHVLGFVGPKDNDIGEEGKYGIEALYEKQLQGVSGTLLNGRATPARSGDDIVLTIEPTVQQEAEQILSGVVTNYGAEGGSVIIEEPATGKIIALAALPSFNPNEYATSDIKTFLNPAVQERYEPGSVFKIITMSAGIDSGKITPETTYVDTGRLTLNGRTIQNYDLKTHGAYGKVTMTNVIEHSINTGSVFAERTMGRDIFTDYVARFGFGEKTGIGLPGELAGDIRRLSPKERDIAFATASYGQGVAATSIEVINAFAAIANDGILMRPYISDEYNPQEIRRVVSSETARKVTAMMISAVDKAGVAAISGYSLAGKTGTAFIPDFKNGGYTDNVINTYIGFGPTSNPKFVIMFRLNNPKGAPVAALTVVPAFRELAQFLVNYYGIAPDRISETQNR